MHTARGQPAPLGQPAVVEDTIPLSPEAPDSESPVIDLVNRRVGPIAFGDPLESARVFGKPDACEKIADSTEQLVHARLGLLLEFDARAGLDYAAFLIAPDEHDPAHTLLTHTRVRFATGQTFAAVSTEADLRRVFGTPFHEDRDDEETILQFSASSLTVECELLPLPAGTLKRLNLFPRDAA